MKQEKTREVIQHRLKYDSCDNVETLSTVVKILSKIELWFCINRSAVFISFNKKSHYLTITNFKEVMKPIEKFWKTKNKILELSPSCKIGEHQFEYKFLSEFESQYRIFLAKFSQTYSLILSKAKDKTTNIADVNFDKAIIAAKMQQHQMKPLKKL